MDWSSLSRFLVGLVKHVRCIDPSLHQHDVGCDVRVRVGFSVHGQHHFDFDRELSCRRRYGMCLSGNRVVFSWQY